MRVTNAATYRNFTSSVNSVHLALNKAMNKVSSGEAYEKAAEAPLAYYEGKKIDSEYMDTLSKISLIKNASNRVYQQELGARTIQGIVSNSGGVKNQVQFARTETTSDAALGTTKDALLQKQHEIVDALNTQYQDFYVYGGNDYKTTPFELSGDGMTLTYRHTFPGDTSPYEITMELKGNGDGTYQYDVTSAKIEKGPANANPPRTSASQVILDAMKEQGRLDIGYGTITRRDTLLDTFTGGFNVLTGMTSDNVIAKYKDSSDAAVLNQFTTDFQEALNKSALSLTGQAVQAIDSYLSGDLDREDMHSALGQTLEELTGAEQTLGSVYADLGNKYRLMETTEDRLKTLGDSLQEQYKDKLGADPYESIMEMYNNNYAYNAALKVGSQLMSSSLFDFVR